MHRNCPGDVAVEIGRLYGKFEVRRELGRGGMGVLYEAWDTMLARRVALKALHPHLCSDPRLVQQILMEARAAAAVQHPNIVHIHGIETLDGMTVIDMEYVDGTPLNELLSFGPLTPRHTVGILIQLLEALASCHRHGIVHCDLKPSNVIVTPQGRAMLTDFGLAAARESLPGLAPDARANLRWGTPAYAPPEAWTGASPAPTWDVFCAGVLAYECITGAIPRMGPAPGAQGAASDKITRISMNAPEGAPQWQQDDLAGTGSEGLLTEITRPQATSPELDKLLQAMLSLDPQNRPADADAVLRLLKFTTEARQATPASPVVNTPTDSKPPVFRRARHEWPLWAALLLLTTASIAFMVAHLSSEHAQATSVEGGIPGLPGPIAPPATSLPPYSSAPDELTSSGDFLYFTADDGTHGRELFAQEPGGGKIHLVKDLVPGPESSNPHGLFPYRGGVLFTATTPETGPELWWAGWVVGTSYAARLVKDIIPGPMGSNPQVMAVIDTVALLYASTPQYGRELWSSMGEENTTALVKDIFPGVGNSVPTAPRVLQARDMAYIVALTDIDRGNCLWRYRFSSNSLEFIADVSEETRHMEMLGDTLIFAQTDTEHGAELWRCDAEASSPQLLADLVPGPEGSEPAQIFATKGLVFFQAKDPVHGPELWCTDGTAVNTRFLKDIAEGSMGSDPYGFHGDDTGTYFTADDHRHGRELWFSDGSAEGTQLVADIYPGEKGAVPYDLNCCPGGVTFSANDGVHGEELWWAHRVGAIWQAELVEDLFVGPTSSEPFGLRWNGTSAAWFAATDPEKGRELFRLEIRDGHAKASLEADLQPGPR